MIKRFDFAIFVTITLLLCGCSKAPSVAVQGQIQVNGVPPVDGTITLTNGQDSVSGKVQADGTFQLQMPPAKTLIPGEYKVLLNPPPVETAVDPTNGEIRAVGKIDRKLFPPKYQTYETSDASQTLSAGANQLKIELQ